jgi:hypothetical protein
MVVFGKMKRVLLMNELLKMLDKHLVLEKFDMVDDVIYLHIKSNSSEAICPYFNTNSNKVHSHYTSGFQNLPIQGKKTIIILNNQKIFCQNPNCSVSGSTYGV